MLPTFDIFGLVAVFRPCDDSLVLSTTLDLPDHAERAQRMRAAHSELCTTQPDDARPTLLRYFAAEITALIRRPRLSVDEHIQFGAACMGLLEETDDDNALIIDGGDRLDYVAIDGSIEEARSTLSDRNIKTFLRKSRERAYQL